ncbi:MAG: hypothetical protein K2X55_00980 [Burkholderiaceae bacterium]|nr:hypothetical protein [Burkholderiaceae bacterium]
MIIGTMEIRLLADIARLQRGMDEARQVVSATSGAIGRIADGMKTALVGAFTSMKAIEAAGALIETQRAFDKLNGSLVTATGSAASAAQAYKALQAFAANTPYGLGEVTEGFVKLRNLGLTPSERALNSYGNTASAMSKSMNQMIEAVADAATGEFERLKEFGIKAKQNGEQVSLTFQGVTTNIANNAGAIEQYLIRLGETNFGGAMERQSRTLDGAISNLGDTWEATKLKFSQGGFGDAAQSNTLGLTAALTDLGAILDVVSGAASKEGAAVQEASLLHKSITTVFETVAVLGVNVAYVFTQVGKELGGLAAQAAAVATGEFALAKQIGVQMRAESEAARKEVDAKSEAILNASAKARKAAEDEAAAKKAAGRDDLAQYALKQQAAGKSAEALKKEAEAAKKAAEEYQKLLNRINGKDIGQDADFQQNIAMLKKGYDAGKQSLEEYVATVEAYIKQQPASIELEREHAKAIEESNKRAQQGAAEIERLYKSRSEAAAKAIEQAEQEAARNEELVATFGMEKSAIEALEVARLQEQLAQRASIGMTLDEITETEKLIAAKQRSAASLAQFEELTKQKQFWIDIDKTAHDTFVSIMDGSKNTAQRLKETFKNVFFDWLYSMTLKKWIVNLQGQVSTSGTGGVTGVAQAAGGAVNAIGSGASLVQTASSLYSAITGGMTIAGGVGTGFVGSIAGGLMGAGAGSGLTSSLGVAIGEGILGVVGPGVASALSTGIGAIATALPWIGGALAVVGLAKAAFGMGPKEITGTTIQGNLGGQGFDGSFQDAWKQKGGWLRSDKSGTTTRAIDEATATGLGDAYSKITMASRDYAKALGVDADYITSRSQSVSIALTKDQAANEKAIADFFTGVANTVAGELVPGIAQFSKEGEAASATLQRLAAQYTAVDAILKSMGATGESAFGTVGVASLAARERLLTLTGGLDALASQTAFFSQNFLSEAERLKPVQDQVTAKMAELGFAGVTTVDAFKNVVVGLQTSGALANEVGANAYADLLKLAPAFKVVADANAAAAKAQAEAAQAQEEAAKKALEDAAAIAQKLADINKPYQDRIAELQVELGYASAARVVEIEAMDASTRSLYEHEQGLLAEKAARDKRNAEYDAYVAKAAQDEQARQAQAAAIAQQRATMEIQLYNLTHTAAEQTAAARERELASIDPVLKGLQQQIYAQQDLADAAAIAAKAIEDAAARAKAIASERAGIERSILQLQGNTAELRKLELAAMDPANRALQESYYALQDKMAAEQAAAAQAQAIAQAQAQAAEEARRAEDALKAARQSATDAIFDEVKRLKGLVDGGGTASLAGAQSAFAIATAQARAGDLDAMKALPGLSKSLLDLAEQNAVSLLDLRRIQAQTAGSLQMTGTSSVSQYGLTVPKFDVGTNQITRTGLAIVHQGEEIVPAASNGPYRSSGTDMNAVLAELRALREEVASFHRDNSNENRGIARDSKRVADGLEQVTEGFDAMRTREEA